MSNHYGNLTRQSPTLDVPAPKKISRQGDAIIMYQCWEGPKDVISIGDTLKIPGLQPAIVLDIEAVSWNKKMTVLLVKMWNQITLEGTNREGEWEDKDVKVIITARKELELEWLQGTILMLRTWLRGFPQLPIIDKHESFAPRDLEAGLPLITLPRPTYWSSTHHPNS